MKTIFDAVNELQGSLSNCRHYDYSCTKINYIYISSSSNSSFTDEIQVTSELVNNNSWVLICEEKEFNALVTEMELGLDVNPVSYQSYNDYLMGNKEPLEPIKQKSNIYTQEMCDNGELPSVGMECLVSNRKVGNSTFEKATILFIGKFVVVYNSESCTERVGDMDSTGYVTFKPITPSTPLIDGKAYKFECDNNTYNGIYDEFNNAMYRAHSITYIEHCTNIKLLTVKGE